MQFILDQKTKLELQKKYIKCKENLRRMECERLAENLRIREHIKQERKYRQKVQIDIIREKCAKLNHTIISIEKHTVEWKCHNGHVFKTLIRHISECKKCKFDKEMKSWFDEGLKHGCLLEKRIGKKCVEWKCVESGHVFQGSVIHLNICRKDKWCILCKKETILKCKYKTEEKCRQILEEYTGLKFPKVRPKWLKNPLTGVSLELDGYCEQLKFAFEYNGIQHYEYSEYFHRGDYKKFEDQLDRDYYKKSICEKNGVILLRIPHIYTAQRDDLITFLKEEYNRLKKSV